ncbi:MAG: hypothetical protein N5P05_000090 [Chroococcopsis gigantea SAG 12.99]|nr:hypothetical protein [Chroococcopsis gigantea SAG 12.99]
MHLNNSFLAPIFSFVTISTPLSPVKPEIQKTDTAEKLSTLEQLVKCQKNNELICVHTKDGEGKIKTSWVKGCLLP